jgi:hypothetical protein
MRGAAAQIDSHFQPVLLIIFICQMGWLRYHIRTGKRAIEGSNSFILRAAAFRL